MTQLERLQARTNENCEGLLEDLLESAKNIILGLRFPYGEWPEELETRYLDLQVRMAEDLYNRIGASGQTGHSENGVSRTWGAEWVSDQLVREVTPYVGIVGGT